MSESKIYGYLSRVGKASSSEIARVVLKVKRSPQKLCDSVVRAIIGNDVRFKLGSDGMWRISQKSSKEEASISQVTFAATSILGVNTLFGREVVEIGAVKLTRGKAESEISFLVDPGFVLPPEFSALTGITERSMREAISAEKLLPTFSGFVGSAVIAGYGIAPMLGVLNRKGFELGFEIESEALCLEKLTRKLSPDLRSKDLYQLAGKLGIPFYEGPRRALNEARLASEVLFELLEMVHQRGIRTIEDLLEFQYPDIEKIDFSAYSFDKGFIESLPQSPGVYIMKDEGNEILYVGKSKNLRSRVRSYFYSRESVPEKVRGILDQVKDISFEVTGSELSSLLRELELIRFHSPRFNIQLEVHEHTHQSEAEDVIIILPASDPERSELFMLKGKNLAGSLCVKRDGSDLESVKKSIERIYYSADPLLKAETGESEIALRWFHANRDRINFIEVDKASGLEDLLRIIESHLSEEGLEKVYHI